MNYKETLEYMESIRHCGIVPGLGNITELCKRLGDPQESLSFVHIAGTNGKGSVLAYISTVLTCAGYRVGRYISPVIFKDCEKIQVNGRAISQKAMAECMTKVREACEQMVAEELPQPTPFEVETAAAFLYFKEKGCDLVVLETGMGGREDATNLIMNTKAAVLASISMDHMQFLGKTLGAIAYQKAGILKAGCQAYTMMQEAEAMEVVVAEAEKLHCPLTVTGEAVKVKYGLEKQRFSYQDASGYLWKDMEISLAGNHQIDNAVLALEVLSGLSKNGYPIKEADMRRGFLKTAWPGRFEVLSKKPYFIADGAHNEDAAQKLARSIRFYFTNKRIIYIMGILKDKEYEKVVAETYAYAEQIIAVAPPDNPRALPALELSKVIREYHPNVTVADSLEEAVEMAYLLAEKEDVIISFGSLSYLGRLTDIVRKRETNAGKGMAKKWIKKK